MRASAFIAAFSLALCGAARADGGPVLYRHAAFATLDARVPRAAAVLVENGRIARVFARDPGDLAGARTVDLGGAWVAPGLHDAHLHLAGLGRAAGVLDLSGTRSSSEAVDRLRAWIEARHDAFVVGWGWDQNDWEGGGAMPTRALLDAVAPETPVLLRRIDGHAAWVNTAALTRARAMDATDPPGGRILRGDDGKPTGVLVDEAMALVDAVVPAPTEAEVRAHLEKGAARAAAAGLTAVHDMGMSPVELAQLRALEREGRLPIRVFVYVDGATGALPEGTPGRSTGRIEVRGVKLYADGALGSRGALLLAPYSDEAAQSGLRVTDAALLDGRIRAAHAAGWQVAVHAIGDRANREVLGVLAALGKDGVSRRHRVEHAQVVDPSDRKRFAAAGAVASMQPTHATSDMPWAERRLGAKRLAGAYAWRSLSKAGAVLAFGSDAPVEDVSPLKGLHAAATRQDAKGAPAGGWTPSERLSVDEALAAFTRGAAFAVHREDELGVLRAGALADFTVLDHDPTTGPPSRLLDTKVKGRVLDGEWLPLSP